MRRWLPLAALRRPVTVLMVSAALLVVGVISWTRIPVQMMPSGFEPNFLWVWLPYPDASPVQTDEAVVRPVVDRLSTVAGISKLRSEASDDSASFSIEFHSSVDMDDAYNDVVDRLERAMVDLPDEIENYYIYKFNPDDEPVMYVGASFPGDVQDPFHVMDGLVTPKLERIPGVASVDVWGVNDLRVYIDYHRDALFAHGVDLGDIQRSLATDNFQLSGGTVEDRGRIRHVRSLAKMDDLDAFRSYPISAGASDNTLRLDDIADVSMVGIRSASISRINGRQGAAIGIKKESTANTVEVTRAVQEELAALSGNSRVNGAEFFVMFSQGDLIEEGVSNLVDTALLGGLFAVVILFVFLRDWRMTGLIAMCIPFSLLITVVILYFRGDSLNLIAMMGLMLAVGMVVDNAVVVVESIYSRRAAGMAREAAAIEGAAEVNLAIGMSTATTMVVFLPVILMSEDAGFSFFMGALGLPVVFALAASLLVALVFVPLASRHVAAGRIKPDPRWLTWLRKGYMRFLRWVLTHRVDAAMGALAAMLITSSIVIPGVQCTDGSDGNINDYVVRFTVPPTASPSERDEIVRAFEDMAGEHMDEWGIKVFHARLGDRSTQGRMKVYLDKDGPMSREDAMKATEEALPDDLPGVISKIGWEGGLGGAGGGNTIHLDLYGEDLDVLALLAEEAVRRLEGAPGVLSATSDLVASGADELRLRVDRGAMERYGLSASSVARVVSFAMRANRLPDVRAGDREIDVVAQIRLEDRSDLHTLLDFPVWSPAIKTVVPLRALVSVEVGRGPNHITRQDRRTTLGVSADFEEELAFDETQGRADAALAGMTLPRGYSIGRGDRASDRESDDAAMGFAMLLSVSFVFLLMGILFESFVLPMSIIATVPMAIAGAFWGLWLTGTPMDTMAGIGLVILVGVVVNNGIVLVDLVTQLRAEGAEVTEALIEAGERRLRPILMTALTTICGLIPMAAGSSGIVGVPYAPLGRTVIGGLAVATVLTLVFVPFLYAVLDDARAGMQRLWAHVRGKRLSIAEAGK